MQNNTTKQLANYWNGLPKMDGVPGRHSIEPAQIVNILPYVFILDITYVSEATFRLAGTGICDMFNKELRDTSFLELWDGPSDQRAITSLIHRTIEDKTLGVITTEVSLQPNVGQTTIYETECILLPLRDTDDQLTRIIGGYSPSVNIAHMMKRDIVKHSASAIMTYDQDSVKLGGGAADKLLNGVPEYLTVVK